MCAFATWQKVYIGAPLALDGYLVPVGFGGLAGLLICRFFSRANQARQKLEAMNIDLEQRVQERTEEVHQRNKELEKALSEINTLQGFIPICSKCHNVRNDKGYWQKVEQYIEERSDARFSHSLCPDCTQKLYPEMCEETEGVSDS